MRLVKTYGKKKRLILIFQPFKGFNGTIGNFTIRIGVIRNINFFKRRTIFIEII
jgi:hypothetical protein